MRVFYGSFVFTAVCMTLAGWWGFSLAGMPGLWTALFTTAVLAVLEVSLSFDNAVVNAKVLNGMDEKWQKIFLTWGILIAVFGMRLVFPVVIVMVAADLGAFEVVDMALHNVDEYSRHLHEAHVGISAFGGMFLLMVFLSFIFDAGKETHWLGWIEEKLSKAGSLKSVEQIVALGALLLLYPLAPEGQQLTAMVAGVGGVVVYTLVNSLADLIEGEDADSGVGEAVKRGGLMSFLYLEVLDASFSFDGVIGAFAISKDVVIIMLGLGIGAMFVRSMTVFLVRKGTLSEFIYLEHGAHYAIGALAAIMLLSMKFHIHELITGGVGIALILAAFGSSILANRRESAAAAGSD